MENFVHLVGAILEKLLSKSHSKRKTLSRSHKKRKSHMVCCFWGAMFAKGWRFAERRTEQVARRKVSHCHTIEDKQKRPLH